jgi:hypothetical protein
MTLLESLAENKWPLLAAILALFLVRMVVRYNRLRHFGGPWGTGFSKIQFDINLYTGDAHTWCRDVSEKYGASCRLCEKT